MPTPKIVWVVLGCLITSITVILIICLVNEPGTEDQAIMMKTTVPVALDLFKIIVGAVVGALGTTVGMSKS